jgi:hypothetical protein
MILSEFDTETKKRFWLEDLSQNRDRVKIYKELERVGFSKQNGVWVLEGSYCLDEPKKRQGIVIYEKSNLLSVKQEWCVFFIRWSSLKKKDELLTSLKGFDPPSVGINDIWEAVFALWTESINKKGDFSFLHKGRVFLKCIEEEKTHAVFNLVAS